MYKKRVILIAITIILTTPLLTSAQSDSVKSARSEVVKSAEKLEVIDKSGEVLTKKEAATQEFLATKEALSTVVDLSLAEVKDIEKSLDELKKGLEDTYALKRIVFLEELNNYEDYLGETASDIKDSIDKSEIQVIAKSFKIWRTEAYEPEIKKMIQFTIVFQTKNTIKKADERISKITTDIKKIKTLRLKPGIIESFLLQASGHIKIAKELEREAQDLLNNLLNPPEVLDVSENTTISPQNTEIANPENSINTEPQETAKTIETLIESATAKVKEAYQALIDLNKAIKGTLK